VLKQHGLGAERRPGITQPLVERAERRAMIGADRQMQGIPGGQAQRILIREALPLETATSIRLRR
jgi:hypothetical protein